MKFHKPTIIEKGIEMNATVVDCDSPPHPERYQITEFVCDDGEYYAVHHLTDGSKSVVEVSQAVYDYWQS